MNEKEAKAYSSEVFHDKNYSDVSANSKKAELTKYLGVSMSNQHIEKTRKRLSFFAKYSLQLQHRNNRSHIETIFSHKPSSEQKLRHKPWRIWMSQSSGKNQQQLKNNYNKLKNRKKIKEQISKHSLQKNIWKKKYFNNKYKESIPLLHTSNFHNFEYQKPQSNKNNNKIVRKKLYSKFQLKKFIEALPIR